MNLATLEPYISLENFTRFEDVPASQWGQEKSVNLVDEKEDDLEYAFTEYGLW